MSQEFKDRVSAIAYELAEIEHNAEFDELPEDLQQQVWRLAETQFVDRAADKFTAVN